MSSFSGIVSASHSDGAGEVEQVLIYKVVETSQVDDLNLEKILNDRTAEGWQLEGIHFAMRDASRRPAMAFITFTREQSVQCPQSE